MFRLDKSFFEYLNDLSDPDIHSSTDLEDIDLKRQIIGINLLTFLVTAFVLFVIINLFIFYLPGLFNVFFSIVVKILVSALVFWPIILMVGLGFVIFAFVLFKYLD